MDLILSTDNDLAIDNGDFVLGDTLYQEAALIMQAVPGWFKNDPILGADINNSLDDDTPMLEFKAHLARHLQRDGKELIYFDIQNETILIDIK